MFISTPLLPLVLVIFDTTSCLQWLSELEIGSYSEYRNVKLLRYDVPVNTQEIKWDFRPRRSAESCEKIPINVILQYGSIPPLNALNETYPDNFYLKRSNRFHISLHPDNTSQIFSIPNPRAGSWYSASFRPYQEGKITQKGLFSTCKYFVSVSYDTPADVYYTPLSTTGIITSLVLNNQTDQHLQFHLTENVFKYTLSMSNCQPDCQDIQIQFLGTQLNSSLPNVFNCTSDTSCQFTVTSPNLDEPQKYLIRTEKEGTISYSVYVQTQECVSEDDFDVNSTDCKIYRDLDRLQSRNDFDVAFAYIINDTLHPITVNVSSDVTNNLPFYVMPQLDMGGTLSIEMVLDKSSINTSEHQSRVCASFYQGYIVTGVDNSELIHQENTICSNSSGQTSGVVNIPYPEPNTWIISLTADCFTENGSSITVVPCSSDWLGARLSVSTSRCYHGDCSGRGDCKEYVVSPSLIIYSTCICSAGWQGYGCTDDSKAFSVSRQLEEVLLLTLSNLFFIPGICLALKRRYYAEALVYTYNMFFSTFYHACDGDREDVYTLCIMKYNVLSFCDFLGSVCSLWVTVVAMAKVYKPTTVLLQISAPLFLVIGVLYDRTSIYVIAVPLLLALVLMAVSWGFRCKKRKTCYPTWRRYVYFLLPGILIATTGALLFAFAETDANYRFIHSVWHMTLSLSIIFLLPPGINKKVSSFNINGNRMTTGGDSSDNDSGLCLIAANRTNNSNNVNLIL